MCGLRVSNDIYQRHWICMTHWMEITGPFFQADSSPPFFFKKCYYYYSGSWSDPEGTDGAYVTALHWPRSGNDNAAGTTGVHQQHSAAWNRREGNFHTLSICHRGKETVPSHAAPAGQQGVRGGCLGCLKGGLARGRWPRVLSNQPPSALSGWRCTAPYCLPQQNNLDIMIYCGVICMKLLTKINPWIDNTVVILYCWSCFITSGDLEKCNWYW